jgi:hypothetical protein
MVNIAQQENLLLAMINDDTPANLKLSCRRILKVYEQSSSDFSEVRRFVLPSVLLDATAYHQMLY